MVRELQVQYGMGAFNVDGNLMSSSADSQLALYEPYLERAGTSIVGRTTLAKPNQEQVRVRVTSKSTRAPSVKYKSVSRQLSGSQNSVSR